MSAQGDVSGKAMLGLPRKSLFGCCACLSAVILIIAGLMIGAVSQSNDAVMEICDRLRESQKFVCRVEVLEDWQVGACDDKCPHEASQGGLGPFVPGMLGLGASKTPEGKDWKSLVPDSKACYLTSPAPGTRDVANVTCPCFSRPMQITITRTYDLPESMEQRNMPLGCIRVSAAGREEPWPTLQQDAADRSLNHLPGCLFVDGNDNYANELAVGLSREVAMRDCEFWLKRFEQGGHFHLLYTGFCLLFSWTFLVSCCGLSELIWRPKQMPHKQVEAKTAASGGDGNARKWDIPEGLVIGNGLSDESDNRNADFAYTMPVAPDAV